MSWTSLANNQTISYGNLQDAVNTGVFSLVSAIPSPANRDSTKAVVSASVSGFNTNYPPYAAKSSNQLVVKGDIYNTGSMVITPGYGMYITSISGTGIPTFIYPINHYEAVAYINSIPAQTLYVYLDGTMAASPLSISLYINSIYISCQNITFSGSQYVTLSIPSNIYAPSLVNITINASACALPNLTFYGLPISATAISRTTGQYQIVGQAYSNLYENTGLSAGFVCTSNDYGATFTQRTPYGYWSTVSVSDDGQYMLAAERYGKAYVSSNYGASWTQITSLGLGYWAGSAISNAGSYMYLSLGSLNSNASGSYNLIQSTNQGTTWSIVNSITNNYGFFGVSVSSTGQYVNNGYSRYDINGRTYGGVYSSSNYASSFTGGFQNTAVYGNASPTFSISSSANGLNAVATKSLWSSGGEVRCYLQKTTDGLNWSDITGGTTGISYWWAVAINNSGTGYAIIRDGANLTYLQQITTLSSVSQITTPGQNTWLSVAISGNGTYILAGAVNGLKRSSDGGLNWLNV